MCNKNFILKDAVVLAPAQLEIQTDWTIWIQEILKVATVRELKKHIVIAGDPFACSARRVTSL